MGQYIFRMIELPISVLSPVNPRWCLSFLPSMFTFPKLSAVSFQFARHRQYDTWYIIDEQMQQYTYNTVQITVNDICATETILKNPIGIFPVGKNPAGKIPIWQNGKNFPWEKFPTGKNKY